MKLLTQMFTTLRNGQTSRKQIVQISYSNLCWNILAVLLLHGYIEGIQRKKQKILVILKYVGDQPAIKTLKQISSSTQRVYSPFNKLKSPQQGLGLLVMSTSKGIMSSSKALDLKVKKSLF